MNLFSSISRGVLTMVLLCVVAGTVEAQRKELPSFVQPAHGEVIKGWLAQSPRRATLRVATDRDCRNKEGLAAERKERRNYQPYYAVGDFNHDGVEDFAVAFVDDRKRRYKFASIA